MGCVELVKSPWMVVVFVVVLVVLFALCGSMSGQADQVGDTHLGLLWLLVPVGLLVCAIVAQTLARMAAPDYKLGKMSAGQPCCRRLLLFPGKNHGVGCQWLMDCCDGDEEDEQRAQDGVGGDGDGDGTAKNKRPCRTCLVNNGLLLNVLAGTFCQPCGVCGCCCVGRSAHATRKHVKEWATVPVPSCTEKVKDKDTDAYKVSFAGISEQAALIREKDPLESENREHDSSKIAQWIKQHAHPHPRQHESNEPSVPARMTLPSGMDYNILINVFEFVQIANATGSVVQRKANAGKQKYVRILDVRRCAAIRALLAWVLATDRNAAAAGASFDSHKSTQAVEYIRENWINILRYRISRLAENLKWFADGLNRKQLPPYPENADATAIEAVRVRRRMIKDDWEARIPNTESAKRHAESMCKHAHRLSPADFIDRNGADHDTVGNDAAADAGDAGDDDDGNGDGDAGAGGGDPDDGGGGTRRGRTGANPGLPAPAVVRRGPAKK